jgi:hypothetical protein
MHSNKQFPVNEWNDIETPEEWRIEDSIARVSPGTTRFLSSAPKMENAKNTIDAQTAIDGTSTPQNQKS